MKPSITEYLTRREFGRLMALGFPALGAAACAARSGAGPNFVSLVAKVSPSVVALGSGTQTVGSGFVVRPNLIVTAAHVAQAAGATVVVTSTSGKHVARVIGTRDDDDLAILEIPQGLTPLALATQPPRAGEWIVVIGNPFGAGTTATAGIISAAPGAITATPQLARQIQINASVNPGNSGGPVCNLAGEVVGATTTLVAAGQGIAFATSAAQINALLTSLNR
jgi:S1-C subfamily serine protease